MSRPIARIVPPPGYLAGFTAEEHAAMLPSEEPAEITRRLETLDHDERPDTGDRARRNADRQEARTLLSRALDKARAKARSPRAS